MLEIISERRPVVDVEFFREFTYVDDPYSGYSFPCDSDGTVHFKCEEAKENYEYAVSHPELIKDLGIVKREYKYTEPAVGKCSCGEEVALEDHYLGACQCPNCGKWYNIFGQELVSPEYWED